MSIMGNVVGLPGPQPDWNQEDSSRADFIRNKPDLSQADARIQQALEQAAAALPQSGGAMTGPVDMAGFSLTGLPDPGQSLDAVSLDYLQRWGGGLIFTGQVTLPAADWTGSGPYIQSAALAGILETDSPHYGPVYSGTLEQMQAQKEAFWALDVLETADGTLTFTCFAEKPEADVTVQLECCRRPGGGDGGIPAMLRLEPGAKTPILLEIDGADYGTANATVNAEPTQGSYDFTVA